MLRPSVVSTAIEGKLEPATSEVGLELLLHEEGQRPALCRPQIAKHPIVLGGGR